MFLLLNGQLLFFLCYGCYIVGLKNERVIYECINRNDEEKAKKDNQINFISKHIRLEKGCLEAEIETDLRVIRLEN